MPKLIDLVGKRFGRVVVIEKVDKTNIHWRWKCLCDCGNTKIIQGTALRSGLVKSCGCLLIETTKKRCTKHGKSKVGSVEKIYKVWLNMNSRCSNPNSTHYDIYGERGITVCDRWKNSFELFYQDMGDIPFPKAQIDRINNNGNYEPSNCKWSTPSENCKNRNPKRWLRKPQQTILAV